MASRKGTRDKDPPSTLALFRTILQKAEHDFLLATAATGGSHDAASSAVSNGTSSHQQARARLFHIATQLAKLNLQDDLVQAAATDNVIRDTSRIWELILDFMARYPDYALYKIHVPSSAPATSKQRQNNSKTRSQDVTNDDDVGGQEAGEDEEAEKMEEMAIWLLPRLLRCMILSSPSPSPPLYALPEEAQRPKDRSAKIRKEQAQPSGNGQEIIENEHSRRMTLLQKGEEGIKTIVCDYMRLFYHSEENGITKRRELVKALIKLAQDASSLLSTSTSTTIKFPSKLFLFQKPNDIALTNIGNATVAVQADTNLFFAQDDQPSSGYDHRNDNRPFYITIDNEFQAITLHFSIFRILISTISVSEQWIAEFVPDITDLVIGSIEEDQELSKVHRRRGSLTIIERIGGLCQRVDCVTSLFRLSKIIPLPLASRRAMLLSIVELFLSPQLSRLRHRDTPRDEVSEADGPESLGTLKELDQSMANVALVLYTVNEKTRQRTCPDLADIARLRRREFIDILLSEKSCGNADSPGGDDPTKVDLTMKYTDRQKFCLALLALGAATKQVAGTSMATRRPLQSITNRDITNLPTRGNGSTSQQAVAQGIKGTACYPTAHPFEEKDAHDILEILDACRDASLPYDEGASTEQGTLVRMKENLRACCTRDIAYHSGKDGYIQERVGEKRKAAPDQDTGDSEGRCSRADDTDVDLPTQRHLADLRTQFAFNPAIEHASTSQLLRTLPALEIFPGKALSEDISVQEKHLIAIEILACNVKLSDLDNVTNDRRPCRLCARQFIMADLPNRSEETDEITVLSPEIVQAMKVAYRSIDVQSISTWTSSTRTRIAFWRAFSSLIMHAGEQPHALYAWLDIVKLDLNHQNRSVRLTAGYAGNVIVTELFRHNSGLSPSGQLSSYFNSLETGLKHIKPSTRLTSATAISDLIRIGSGAILGKALSLGIIALASQGHLRAVFTAQLDSVFKVREIAPYKFFSPYLHQLCPIISRHLDASFTLLYVFTDLLRTTVQSFLQTPDISRIFLSESILAKREDLIQILAECMEISAAELLVLNADCCFAPLYFMTASKFEECKSFYMKILQAQSFKTTFQQLLEGDLPAVLLEVLIRADPENTRQLDSIIQRIFRDVNKGQSLSVKDANALLGRSGTILAVFGRAGDSMRGMYGKKNSEERARLLQGMEILVTRVGQIVAGAAPQIMTILQTSFKDREVRLPALRLWKRFLETVRIDEVKPLIAQTTAVFIQAWPDLTPSEKTTVKSILQYFLIDQYKNLEDALTSVADMSSIPELDTFQKRLITRRQGQSAEERIKAYLGRLDTVNEATLVQTLRELLQHLRSESSTIHKLAAGSSFSPLLGQTIHTLLTTAIRSSEAKSQARALAFQCLGVLGALDPDRVTFPPEESAFVIEHDLRTPEECMKFAVYTVDKVLLRVLRTTNDPQQQTALYLAIQGLAAVCGFNESLRAGNSFKQGIDATIRSRWNALPRHVQDVMEPLISASIKVESSVKAEKPEYPLYSKRTSYREWLQTWTSDLIDHLVQGHASITLAHGPAKLFGPLRAAVRRGHDLTVPHYILPFLVFYTITSGNTTQTANISREIQTVLQDQIAPSDTIPMPTDSRSLCAQAVFELMDRLNTWRRARLVLVAKRFRRKDLESDAEGHLFYTKKIDSLFQSLPQNMVADAAFNAKSHARALLNYERILYGFGSKTPSSQLQNYYERLHNIYAELNEPDGMEGVSVSIISPSLEHQIREHEMTGRWTSAQSCWEVQLQLQPENPASHLGLLRCLRNLGHYDSLKTHIAGLQVKHANWQNALSPYELESALISGDISAISSALEHANPSCPEAAFARVVLALKESPNEPHALVFLEAAESLGSTITTASKDSYHRFYDTVVKLHMLHEVETLFARSSIGGAALRQQSKADQIDFDARLDLTSPAFNTREAILNMRRNIYRLCGAEEHTNDIGPLWLMTSKIAIKAQHLQTAYSAILQANQLKADFAFMQSAKLYRANNHLHRALQEIEQGLKLLGALDPNSSNKPNYDTSMLKNLAKATLRSARWMQETGRFEHSEIMARYVRAVKLSPEWEAAYYRLGQYADDIVQASPPFEKTPGADGRPAKANELLLSCMEVCVHYFSRALRFGAKFIYQALPRMVTIWLDLGAWPDIALLPTEAFFSGAAGGTGANNSKMRKVDQLKQNQPPAIKLATAIFEKIHGHVRRSLEKLPPYMWLSVLPQLVSRINHESPVVYAQLVYLVERVIQHYPQQAIWTMLGVLYSANTSRRERCTQILKRAQANPAATTAAGATITNQALTATVRTLQELVRCFLEMAAMKVEGSGILSMAQTFPALKAMVPCDIIIPLQNAMTITLPTNEKVPAHKPFPSDLVTFHAFKDEVDVMSSLAKPRKIVIIGSDGQSYRFLCKPLDDLRKDNRFNECTALIGKLLMKDPEARKRGLCIRTYAVIPLSEQCGLIEWVPDTQGIRNLFISCYEPRGISVWNEQLKKVYEGLKTAQKTDLVKCGKVFTEQVLPAVPPIFHEWFMSNFPEPTAWLKARTNYGRTAAVMSMVGFVLGLGDRHGENILIDTTNGDVVHVDFNCLFGMGQVHFDIAEKVPFRLTQNVIDGFGITGVEGVFRRCCEITLRILRENRISLISVLESFVHDPLLDLQLTRGGRVERKNIGAARNETKEQKARREEEQRKTEARNALAIISNKLKGTQSTTFAQDHGHGSGGASTIKNTTISSNVATESTAVVSVEMTVETLFKEATDPKNLGGMYVGWAGWL